MPRAGDKVVFEMIRFPTHVSPGEGVLTEVLGKRGEPEVDTLLVIRQYGLPESFSESAMEQARETRGPLPKRCRDGRTDFTPWTTITIDPHDARDFDDAISLQQLENGHWRLAVHIADVSHFVPAKSPLDREAVIEPPAFICRHGPAHVAQTISNHVASLQPHRIRYTLTAVMEMTAEGARVATDVYRACHSQRSTADSMKEVDAVFGRPNIVRRRLAAEVILLLNQMHTWPLILRARRMERGAIELTLPEISSTLMISSASMAPTA